MCTTSALVVSPTSRLKEILLDHLAQPCVTVWPGADGLTVEEVLGSYHQAVDAGQAPGPEELLARHSDLAAPLKDFFAQGRQPSQNATKPACGAPACPGRSSRSDGCLGLGV